MATASDCHSSIVICKPPEGVRIDPPSPSSSIDGLPPRAVGADLRVTVTA